MSPCLQRVLLLSLGLALGAPLPARAEPAAIPPGWFIGGSHPEQYLTGVEPRPKCEGPRTAFLRSKGNDPLIDGTLMQVFRADDYRGKRVRFSAMVQAHEVSGWTGLFLRIDGRNP